MTLDWVTNPASDSVYNIYASSTSNVSASGIAQSGGNTNIRLATNESDQDDFYNGSLGYIIAGTGSGQTRIITDYAGGTTDATVDTWSVNPDSTSLYEVIPAAQAASGDQTGTTAPTVADIWTGISSEAIDDIWAKAVSDLAAGAPSSTASVFTAINYLYEAWRNKTVTDKTNSEIVLYKDNGSTKLIESDISDDGTLFTRSEWGAAD
jgi:hypothetical protein